jgi:hypothetical protein
MISFESFSDELVKIAFGADQASKVLSLAKRIQLPKASARVQPFLSASPNKSRLVGDAVRSANLISPGAGEHVRSAVESQPVSKLVRDRPAIFPGSGSIQKQMHSSTLGGLGNAPKVPADQRKMLHAVVKGHELDESSVRGRIGAAHYGHRSPDVIFREHNRLATLPPGNEAVRAHMKHYREGIGEASLMPARIPYGSGTRLSRHARRRLTDLQEQKTIKQYNSP